MFLILAVLFFLLREPFYDFWSGWGPIARLSLILPSPVNDAAALVLAVLGVLGMVAFSGHLTETGKKWARIVSGSVLYMTIVLRICFGDSYVPFATCSWLYYADALIPVMASLWISSCFTRQKIEGNDFLELEQNLLYDDNEEVDFLGRDAMAADLCKELLKNKGNSNGATGVAITGEWGTGKSWFMTCLRTKLEKAKQTCVEFKPWLYGETNITRQFYILLERRLKLNDMRTSELKAAVAEIDNDNAVGLARAFLSLLGMTSHSAGREKTVENVKDRLRKMSKPIYVFVDDCDRLARNELLEVLSLVRNTGDFPHITYVMAFSSKMVAKTLEKEEGLQYVSKMFNLTKVLPPITDEVISDFLFKSASSFLGRTEEDDNPYQRIAITKFLPTVREAKKYLNLLIHDYKRLQERFSKYHYHTGDFCLIELLKFKWPNYYYTLQSDPLQCLEVSNNGWNSPIGTPIRQKANEEPELLSLMQALFRERDDLKNSYDGIGVANMDYFPLYFEKELAVKYVDKNEINKALEDKTLPQKVGEWVDNGCVGTMGLISAVHNSMSRKDVFLLLSEYIWHSCERMVVDRTLSQLTYGYELNGHDIQHGFKTKMDFIEKTPQISLLAFQHLSVIDTKNGREDDLETLIRESKYTLELMGVMMNLLKEIPNTDYPYDEVKHYVIMLWQDVVNKSQGNAALTMDVVDVLGACTLEDTFTRMVLPLVKKNPQRWLGATVMKVRNGDKAYYLVKNRAVHAIFGSLDKMHDELHQLVGSAKEQDKDYVSAYFKLLNSIASMNSNRKSFLSGDTSYMSTSSLETKGLAVLSNSVFVGMDEVKPIRDAIDQMWSDPFWRGEDRRIHRVGVVV